MSVLALSKYLGKEATWRVPYGETTIHLTVKVRDAKEQFGKIRFQIVFQGQRIWVDQSSLSWPEAA